jgi:ABC-type dipeptide/oligopeptide/nickel transport system ATPase component
MTPHDQTAPERTRSPRPIAAWPARTTPSAEAAATSKSEPLVEVRNLEIHFVTHSALVRAVDGVTYTIDKEKTLGIVGESGCGKTVTAYGIMGLVQSPPGKIVGGEVLYHRNGTVRDLTKLPPKGREMRSIRGNEIAMIFQEPMTSLNPVYTIGSQIVEAIVLHQRLGRKAAHRKAVEMLQSVHIPLAEQRVKEYPHQL